MNRIKRLIICGLICALCLGSLTTASLASDIKIPSETNAFVPDYYVEPINQEAPFFDKVLPEIKKNIKENNQHTINKYYDNLPVLNNPENLQSLGSTTYANINGQTVTADAYFHERNEPACNPNLGLGIMLYQCIEYKRAHPEEDVKITFSSYHTSATTAVCVIPESKYYGYMRSLFGTNYDEHGFVRISYMLTEAARMGIEVTMVNQLETYASWQLDPVTEESVYRGHLSYRVYFDQAVKSDCYEKYAPGKKVSDFLNCVTVDWKVKEKTEDMMHLKSATVSHYLATDGTVHKNAIFLSTGNLDEIDCRARNGSNNSNTSVIVSDHADLYRVMNNYTDLLVEYKGQEDLFELRKEVKRMNEEQYELITSGRGNEIPADEQILYLGTPQDKVFKLYFTPLGGTSDGWDTTYNPICEHVDKLAASEDYVEFAWNNWETEKDNLRYGLEKKLTQAYCDNPNPLNKIMIRTAGFDPSEINKLNLGSEIGTRDIQILASGSLQGIHSKDFQLSYMDEGIRHRVSIITSANYYMHAYTHRINGIIAIDETDQTGGNFYNILGEEFSYGMIDKDLMVNPANLKLDVGATYNLDVDYAGTAALTWTSSNPSVATVENGKLTALKSGKTTITVTDGTHTDTMELRVLTCVKCDEKKGGQTFNTEEQLVLSKKFATIPLTFESVFSLNQTSLQGDTTLFGSDDGYDQTMTFQVNENGHPKVAIRTNKGKNTLKSYVFDKVNVATGDKVHMSVVMDFAKKNMYCYVNGKLKQTINGVKAIPASFQSKHKPLVGGDYLNGNSTPFAGEMYSVALWSDMRTKKEIANDFAKGITRKDGSLLAFYDLTACEKCMLEDLSRSDNDLKHVPLWLNKSQISPLGDFEYAFAIVGDTRTLSEKDPVAMEKIYEWIVANKHSHKIKYVLGLGDITENRGNDATVSKTEWDNASKATGLLNGEIPYSLSRGDHDNLTHFNQYLHNGVYETTVDGQMTKGDLTNTYRYVNIQGKDYLIMTLDFAPSSKVLNWANRVIKNHPNHKVIVTTHAYMYRDGTTLDAKDQYPPTYYKKNGQYADAQNGDDMWKKCFSKHKNVLMVLSGHDPWQNIVYRQDKGVNGNYVTQMLINPQNMKQNNEPAAMVAMMYFSNDGNTITMRYYSVEEDSYGSPVSQFTIDLASHKHTYETSLQAATLTANGQSANVCTTCGETADKQTVYAPTEFTLAQKSFAYNGKVKTPKVTVKDSNGKTLAANKDYILSYETGRVEPGKYTVEISFMGMYAGNKKLSFNIAPAAPKGVFAKGKTIDATLSWKAVKGADGYEVFQYDKKTKTFKKVGSVANARKYTVNKLKGMNEYKFKVRAYTNDGAKIFGAYSKVVTVKTKKPMKAASYKLSKSIYTYDGKAKAPAVIVKDAKGNVLKKGKDYTVSYGKGRKAPGKYSVKITCKGNYTGTKNVSFKIRPAAPMKMKAKQTTSKITLSWAKVPYADGYKVYKYDTKSKKYKLVSTQRTKSYKAKKLKSGTEYKFMVKAYEKDGTLILGKGSELSVSTKTVK